MEYDINDFAEMFREDQEEFDEEIDDNKLWQEELARQADACNRGLL